MANVNKWKEWGERRISRKQNWNEGETTELIDLWSKYVDILKLHRRTGKIYQKMAREFAQRGFDRTANELQKKVSNLTQEYRKEKIKMINGLGPSKWKFFHVVEGIVEALAMKGITQLVSPFNTQSSSASESDVMDDDVQFMAVYLNDDPQGSDEEEEEEEEPPAHATHESPMPVIVSVHSEGLAQRSVVVTPVPPNSSASMTTTPAPFLKELQTLKTSMHRALEESLNIHRQQVSLQQRQVTLQEDMLKIMAKFIDQCP